MRRADLGLRPLAFFADPGTQPLADQAKNTPVADTMFQELDQPRVVDRVEEAFDIGIQYPVHPLADEAHAQRIERLVATPSRPEAVAETKKILLVDAL